MKIPGFGGVLIITVAAMLLTGCADDGRDGVDGSNGQNGADGADGADGANGANGNDGRNARNGRLHQIGRYESGIFEDGGAEIVAYDAGTMRLFVVNASDNSIDVLDITNPSQPEKLNTIDVAAQDSASFTSGGANSVAVKNGILAVAVEADVKQDNGRVYFYNTDTLAFIHGVTVGALPDMVTFTPDGLRVLSANEAEPSNDYQLDPEGSVSIINIGAGVASATVTHASFTAFNGDAATLKASGVRLFGPNASVAQDLEPEYIAVSSDSSKAYVTLQENNALAIVDIGTATVTDIKALSFKNHNIPGMGLDANRNDKYPNIENLKIYGMYMPDAIASYSFNGKTYLVTANEGDGREYIYDADSATCTGAGHTDLGDGECLAFADETALEDLTLDSSKFSADEIALLQDGGGIGDLTVSRVDGDADNNGQHEKIYAYGARSFSIWSATGSLIYDSGDQVEQIIADTSPLFFNLNNTGNGTDNRSDNKGPEPEGVAIGEVNGRTYAFVGLERQGGIMVFDISNPFAPGFVEYVSNRDLSVTPAEGAAAGDLGPEGLLFVPASDSPNDKALLIVGNEISGTTTIYEVE
ncbi:choice-of-anchor I family protein [Permianibacter aggregans]|uniref:LVIVD repeat-containing protein n=1 Tax=Permianibacter aggregans TaxID=1510150 RepID=A0A4R6USQ2_9GAMM|nr:choice-of-anchor I family protein [Permianibacter aggregans]QGX38366.1 alkaline phosphatase [Permianibacter aggregans]TDQ48693.1 LVIVD repeat-containing protein [Permianibacter aggregans]